MSHAIALAAMVTAATAAPLALPVAEAPVAADRYYVGRAMGERDFRALANASTPGFRVMTGELSQRLVDALEAWGTLHGYAFATSCTTCAPAAPDQPATGIDWRNAALLANALSEANGLDPVYRDKAGQPIRAAEPPESLDQAVIEPSLSGFRLPTIPEWQIAMRGAAPALADGTYGAAPSGHNALGLSGTAGPLVEWTASRMDGEGKPSFYVCNAEVDGQRSLSNCRPETPGWTDAAVAVRLIRKAAP